jgi:predicted DNA-binding protein (MmcQ/YjbR family)
MMKRKSESRRAAEELREYALGLPGAYEDFPWGERVAKVGKKVFAFLGKVESAGEVGVCVKLPASGGDALELPFTEPAGYGLGKSGWVVAKFAPDDNVPVDLLRRWIEESYRAVAPKKLVAELDRGGGR